MQKSKTVKQGLRARLEVLEATEAIKQLKAEYCYRVDDHDWKGVTELFALSAVYVGGSLGAHKGRRAIEAFFKGLPRLLPFSVHMVHNPVIEVSGATARGRWYWTEPCTTAKGNQALWIQGRYDEEYVKERGRWRFKSMILTFNYITPYDRGWARENRERI